MHKNLTIKVIKRRFQQIFLALNCTMSTWNIKEITRLVFKFD